MLKTDQQHWSEQRELAREIREKIAQYTESKYSEYRWVRSCSHQAAYNEANEQIDTLVSHAITDATNAVQIAELDRRNR